MANLRPEDFAKLEAISRLVESLREDIGGDPPSFGDKAADWVTRVIGRWVFIGVQGVLLLAWMVYNLVASPFDSYPFILLNLLLAVQAAFLMPIILMAQNRADEKEKSHSRKAQRAIVHTEQLVKLLAQMEGIEVKETDHA